VTDSAAQVMSPTEARREREWPHGAATGVVELPPRLDWSEQGRYDLSDPRQRNLMYEVVIRESMRVEDLRTYVHGPTLARVWRRLWLPRKARSLWESQFPSLPRAA
jgi:hypothetical protein